MGRPVEFKFIKVLTVGTFDLNHAGHIALLDWCRMLAGINGIVVVGLNSDDFIKRYKGEDAILNYEEREAIMSSYKQVDSVVPNLEDEDLKPTILAVKPNILVVGSDWMKKDYFKQTKTTPEWFEEQGIALCFIPRYLNKSTTNVKKKVRKEEENDLPRTQRQDN